MRIPLLDALTDADLAFSPGGLNMTLGGLLREMGEVEYSYIQSLKTFKQDWAYHNSDPSVEKSTAKIKAWYQSLDDDFKATVEKLTDADLQKPVQRGFDVPPKLQLDIYLQALLIFFGKASIFLKAMNKPLPKQIQDWIW
jgi:hypothetical protein